VIITLGFFSFFQWDFDLTVLAAILALIGYSINDTIVIYDRIRENFRLLRKMDSLDIINISLTQTLGRSVMTSGTTLIVLVCLFLFGGELMRGFATALIIGILVGTYSSTYIAAHITAALGVSKEDLMPREKEGAELDETP
jgi:preprotein translocase subunit SecF